MFKFCETCKYERRSIKLKPCEWCYKQSNWEPKQPKEEEPKEEK